MSDKKRCLVLGANGFVGSHLVDELAAAGYQVRAFDRFNRRRQFLRDKNIEVFKGDAYDEASTDAALKDVDYFFHCFSATTPYSSDNDPFSDIDKNLRPSVRFFEQCLEHQVKKVIYVSSGGAIYGSISERRPARETDMTTPVSPYGITKLATENYLAYFNRKFGLDFVAYRLANPYGPRQANRTQGVIPIFIDKITAGKELVVYGDGTSSRDYLYVRDATKMIVESFSTHTKYQTYNIGSGRQTDLNKIIKAVEKATGKKAKVHYKPAPKTFLQKSMISVARFNREFGSKAKTPLTKGLKQTLKDQ
jgi:UDP-glucose 4-epimerase